MTWAIYSESAELLLECSQLAQTLALSIAPQWVEDAVEEAINQTGPAAVLTLVPLPPEVLVRLSDSGTRAVMCLDAQAPWLSFARDLGVFAVQEIDSFCAGLAAIHLDEPWRASTRSLPTPMRKRIDKLAVRSPSSLYLERTEQGLVCVGPAKKTVPALPTLGSAPAVYRAFHALRATRHQPRMAMPRVESVDTQGVLDVLLGPPRALSDPASKDALARYDMPMPEEVLCASASRAASEATRIGYPVRVALASPDLRACDHPDLVASRIDNAARVRDVFKQMKRQALLRAPQSRVLGVTVSATSEARTLLSAHVRSIAPGLCFAELGFADAHGKAAGDKTAFVLPCNYDALETHVRTLRGHSLILGTTAGERKAAVEDIADVLLRAAVFSNDWRDEVVEVRLEAIALLVGRGVEVREACVVVSDAFTRSLEAGL